jgi:CO/xanthine dehydrogenase FAD-binding subunit
VAYERIGFRERPIVNVAIVRTSSGTRVVAGGGGRSAARIAEAEAILTAFGEQTSAGRSALADAAAAVARTLDPTEDLDGSASYKRHLVQVVFHRATRRVFAEAANTKAGESGVDGYAAQ